MREKPMSKWTGTILTALVPVASAGIAWGVMSTRVSAAEVRLDDHHRRIGHVERQATATEWMLYRICEAVGAQPCLQPGDR